MDTKGFPGEPLEAWESKKDPSRQWWYVLPGPHRGPWGKDRRGERDPNWRDMYGEQGYKGEKGKPYPSKAKTPE